MNIAFVSLAAFFPKPSFWGAYRHTESCGSESCSDTHLYTDAVQTLGHKDVHQVSCQVVFYC